MPLDQQAPTGCSHCRKKTTAYDLVGEEFSSGKTKFARIRCHDCGQESWRITRPPFRCYFGRTFYPDGSIGPREAAQKD